MYPRWTHWRDLKGNLPHLRGTRTRRNEQKDGQALLEVPVFILKQ